MHFEQMQFFCRTCGRPTLHTRNYDRCPHMLHALVTLFLCGLWAPVWVLHALSVASENNFRLWRCNFCGQAAGTGGQSPPGAALPNAAPQTPFGQPSAGGPQALGGPAHRPPKDPPPPRSQVTGGWG